MDKIKVVIKRVSEDKKAVNRLYFVSFITALLLLIMVIKNIDNGGDVVCDKTGKIVGIERESLDKSEEYSFNLKIKQNNEFSERKITINLNPVNKKSTSKTESSADTLEAELNGAITDIEMSESKKIQLPSKLPDGTRLYWKERDTSGSNLWSLVLIYMVLVFATIKTSMDSDKSLDKERRSQIVRSLPRFTNQLLLMMNSGMILSDAFQRICDSYKLISESERGVFENELIAICESNADHRSSTSKLISDFANQNNVKELIRIATILTENEKRGCDVLDNLERESRYLWDNRKIIAIEKGKLIDTKMAYPLGMLLILLIVITMAPALLTM